MGKSYYKYTIDRTGIQVAMFYIGKTDVRGPVPAEVQ